MCCVWTKADILLRLQGTESTCEQSSAATICKTMERLPWRTGRRGPFNDTDAGQNVNGRGERWRRRGGEHGDRDRDQEGRRRARSRGGGQGEREEMWNERGGGMRGRGRGGRGAGAGILVEAGGAGEGLRGRGIRRGGGADIWRGGERDADRHRGGGWGENRGGHAEWQRQGRNGVLGGADRERGRMGMGERRGGLSGDRRAGMRDEKREGSGSRVHILSYKTLEELSEEDPSVVAITLSSNPGFQALLCETPMRQDLVQLICLVLNKAFTSRTDRGTLQHLAGIIKDSKFFQNTLVVYVGGMVSEPNPKRRALYPQQLENILTILSEVLNVFPASSVKAVSILLTLLQASINSLRASGEDIQPQMEENVENLKGLIEHLEGRSREGTLRSDRDTYVLLPTRGNDPDEEEHQDFRTIPLYPTPEEFHQEQRPFLRPNITSQRYTNTHLYLDTHFRLLREDFVRPLREGIQQLLQSQMDMGRTDNPVKTKRFDDIRVYFDTQLVVPKCTHTGLAYIVQFDSQPLKFVRWQNSKRLLFGSLVCLSYDNFESFLFATVSDRDPTDLQKGQVTITFTEESRIKLARIQTDQLFLMVETTAYFEAYRYVLEGLKEQTEENLPFQRYIVECSTDVEPPSYLNGSDTYDLSPIAEPLHKVNMGPFNCLDQGAWPTMEELGLDESQMKAFQLALTKELAIVQGPPGTGKTYVGLKIARALLTNKDLWNNDEFPAPMLVVCYTNHALDQFLEGIHTFLKNGIVRVGGRSNSEILKQFNLRELTHSRLFRHSLPSHLRSAYNQIHKELSEKAWEIQSQSMKLECSLKGVMRESFLQRFISDGHWDSLNSLPIDVFFVAWNEKPSLMMEWLGLGSTVVHQRETENANANEEMELEEDLIEIAEEADLIQEERMIEDGWTIGPGAGRDDKKKREMEETAREVEELMLAMNLDKADIQAEQNEEGWQMQRDQRRKMKNRIRKELGKSTAMTEEEEDSIYDVWSLSLGDRWRLYRLWVTRYRVELRTKALVSEQAYQNAVDRLADVKRRENLQILKRATVIGMTTTGAAKFREALQEVCPRVVIVEEAAEVLEAHTITTLSRACQHLILIGDHQQLRPSATVYELAKNFNLEMSMFERLVKMGLPYVRLNYQHRMRPDIACLLTPHIYSELENHPSVLEYENIMGLNTNLFFVEHNHPEEEIRDGKSHQNSHEANFVVALCRYLLLQGYKPEQITILTTYTGQLHCLRKLMPATNFSGVKVHVVDKYQGEENDIVLLSLVRSNLQGKVGFLSIPNRVCVALSRAKKGLYCIGNSVILSRVALWSNIFHTLRDKEQMGKALTLCCQNHPDRQIQASCADDFKQAPEGGCIQPCQFRLDCGHVCSRVCHPYDSEHKEFKCGKRCEKILCDQGHRCTLVCHKQCPKKCPLRVEKIIPQCQHTQMIPCHQDPETFTCQEPCQKLLRCGHQCDSVCGQPCSTKCKVKVTLELQCGHNQKGDCYYKTQTEEPECRARCELLLKCGHVCPGTCGRCFKGRFHNRCSHRCERLLVCSHKCIEPCTRDCPPCQRPCENCCVHSKCMRPCGQPCAPCIEPCAWQCPHQRCSKLCHEPCDRPPCTRPCTKTLACGHPCIGLCGDKCPSKCRMCHHDEVTEIFFGTEDEPEAYFIQLEDCGHIIESTAMDHFMGLGDNSQANEGEEVAIKLKECPKCKTPIRKNLRYGSHINRCLTEIEMVKKKINGHQLNIEEQRKDLQNQWKENLEICEVYLGEEYMRVHHKLKETYLTANDLWVLENQIDFLTRLAKLLKTEKKNMLFSDGYIFRQRVTQFLDWLKNPNQKFTDQQVFDLQRELCRLSLMAELFARCQMAENMGKTEQMQSEVQDIRDVLKISGQFTEQDQLRVKEALKRLDEKFQVKGLGISDEERKMIVSAMKMPPGHWHKCPNGHVYLITECGGAMERRRCPDCNVAIGGENHTLDSSNQVATEMDGALHSAWSEANNLLNFDHLHL
ncbi:NFX1-type zinc finger-containing protein 1 isoform X2 [Leuresthes tenuis]|uniref:NFX1-type zinc finger-containing protein 1 isoform X2 n=1 Tax=Leuresthes tenuis TaxID=355514 RepID=UPI003B514509